MQSVIEKNLAYNELMAGRPPTKEAPEFGQRLAKFRKARGWTQSELAERLDTTVKTVTYYEREATNPTQKTLEKLGEILDVTPSELMGEVSNSKNGKPGPASKLEKLTAQLAKLPKSKQKVVIDMLEGYLKQINSS